MTSGGADFVANAAVSNGGRWLRLKRVNLWCAIAFGLVADWDWKRLGIVASAVLIGLGAGIALRPLPDVSAHTHGACAALDMATAYGFLDDTKRKIVTRALAQQNNPHAAHFPGGYRALTTACATFARTRWSQP